MVKIHPLNGGTITRPMTGFGFGFGPEIVNVPLICWYIEGADKRIVVDTGGGDPLKAPPKAAPYKREADQSLEAALKKIGVRCADIDIVVVTHLHWDHCGETDLFPKAKIYVQKEELETARSPFPKLLANGYFKKMLEEIDYTIITGDKEIAKGVKIVFTPGHSYGFQSVLGRGGDEEDPDCRGHLYFLQEYRAGPACDQRVLCRPETVSEEPGEDRKAEGSSHPSGT